MNASRALRLARRRAGLSQTELARRAGVPVQNVNRIERGLVDPRFATLQRLLRAAGASLAVVPRADESIDRGPIRELLRLYPRYRLGRTQREALDELCRRRLRFVVVGDAACRLQGAPVDVRSIDIVVAPDAFNLRKLERALSSPAKSVVRIAGHADAVFREAEELPWQPAPEMRVLNRWLDEPSGFVRSIDELISSAPPVRRELLHAVREETDLQEPGYRVYRDPDRRGLRLPTPPREYRRPRGMGGLGTVRNNRIR